MPAFRAAFGKPTRDHRKRGRRICTRWPHQSDFVFDERSGAAVDPGQSDNDGGGGFGDLSAMLKVPDNVASDDAVWAWLWTLSAHCYTKSLFRPALSCPPL